MRIGIITAMAEETLPIYQKLGNLVASNIISGVAIRKIELGNHTIYLATSGIGEIKAALATQLLIDLFDIEVVLNFGFVGSLQNNLDVGEMVLAERVSHYQFDLSAIDGTEPGQYDKDEEKYLYLDQNIIKNVSAKIKQPLKLVTVASGDKFVANQKDKEYLRNDFQADICEMELAGITIAAKRNDLPVFSCKIVSDKANEESNISFRDVVNKGLTKYEELLPSILEALNPDNYTLPPRIKSSKELKNI